MCFQNGGSKNKNNVANSPLVSSGERAILTKLHIIIKQFTESAVP